MKLNILNIDNKIELNWLQADATRLTGYNIYCKELTERGYKKIAIIDVKQTSYTDNTIQSHKTYLYKIKSVNSRGESAGFAGNSIKAF